MCAAWDELKVSEAEEDSYNEKTIVCFMAIDKNDDEGKETDVNDDNP